MLLVCPHLGKHIGCVKLFCRRTNRIPRARSHKCDLHRRCLPTVEFDNELLEEWKERKPESDLFAICSRCPDNPER